MNNNATRFGKREKEVVDLLMQGKSNNQIAYALGISVRTVEYHLGKVYAKLNVASRTETIIKLSKTDLWESTTPKSNNLGESRIENAAGIGDDEVKTSSPSKAAMTTTPRRNKPNPFWIAVTGLLTLLCLGLVLAGVWLGARELLQSLATREAQSTSEAAQVDAPTSQTAAEQEAPAAQLTAAPIPTGAVVWPVIVSPGTDLRLARTWHTATRLTDGKIMLIGGCNGADESYALVEIYDPQSGYFDQTLPLHTPRHEHTATLLPDGRVLVVGGYNAQYGWLADAEVYHPGTNTWTVVRPIYSHGVVHTATLLTDGRVLVVGGCIASGICIGQAEIFNPQTNAWTDAAPLASQRASHHEVLLDDGRVLVAGGSPGDRIAWLYDPLANNWTPTGGMYSEHALAAMVKLPDGRVLIAGGINISDYPIALTSTEIYTPETNTWTAAAPLAQPRYGHILAVLPDGQVLAVGGAREYDYPVGHPGGHPWTAESFVLSINVYDPRSDIWITAGELPQGTTHAAAVFLPDGRLWVTGGGAGGDSSKAWANTWVIMPDNGWWTGNE
ncbi:MAG TPA: kelch repeat-containing protein [Anaerolineales bacterium]|nr:kelch repeat-containing protein [Anaerolineales bacterium]